MPKLSKHSTQSKAIKHGRQNKGAVNAFGSRTDVGSVRDHNEDSLVVQPPLFAVADGMGGHEAGEVASEIAINVITSMAPEHPDGEVLARAAEEANHEIIRASFDGRGREGMGTTLTAAMLEGERLVIAQVGDSRAYLLHHGKMQQLTRDHSLMADMIEAGKITPEEARIHPQRSVITRALGSDPNTTADIYEINVQAGDRLLLCSDGLYTMVPDGQIEHILTRTTDPQLCAAQLVNEAIGGGGHDNITVIVADVSGFVEEQRKKVAVKTKVFVGFILALIVAIVAGFCVAANTYLHTIAYLSNDNGKVAIYQGVPGDILGLNFSEYIETTDVSVDDLQPGVASRLSEGIRVDSLEAARGLVQDYKNDIKQREEEASRAAETSKDANDSSAEDDTASSAATSANSGSASNASSDTNSTEATNEAGTSTTQGGGSQ